MPLGLYVSVPFCRTKCSYCNFASDVFSRAVFEPYIDRVCSDIARASDTADQMGARLDRAVDSIYLGGGTPTVLDITQLERLFVTISQNFEVQSDAEITVECAPGTLTRAMLEAFSRCGVNRVSLGVQSFVDEEAASVGRLHNRSTVVDDITRLRDAGTSNINIDLIAGLPHQTAESWQASLTQTIACGVPHVSVYMLEVDEDSRLGRELIAGGTRYHAHFVPDENATADFYEMACEQLNAAGVPQYEISNFAREASESRHNLKYWTRQPYLGFGVDAHSMLPTNSHRHVNSEETKETKGEPHDTADGQSCDSANGRGLETNREGHDFSRADTRQKESWGFSPGGDLPESIRFSTSDSLEQYVAGAAPKPILISPRAALEETFFLGLRLTRGLDLTKVAAEFGDEAVADFSEMITELGDAGLMERVEHVIKLTPRGRLLSNEVFERFISIEA
jgi:oxygen-independent coproporphyrinogen-3 oxidase